MSFFVVAATLFPLGLGPDPRTLREIAPGVVWVSALLAAMQSAARMFAADFADGTLEQVLLAPQSLPLVVAGKILAHWIATGLPLVVVSPLLGLLYDMQGPAILTLTSSLLLGTPILSLLGAIGAALTLGLRSGGMLVLLLVLPLTIPTLIFGAAAVGAVDAGLSARPHLSLLGALLILSALGAPLAASAALRISLD